MRSIPAWPTCAVLAILTLISGAAIAPQLAVAAETVIDPGQKVTPGPVGPKERELLAREPVPFVHAVAIGGYSPVSYFEDNAAVLGKREFAVAYQGEVYYLTSAEQVELFLANPQKFRPRYQTCPFSLVNGKELPLDPTNFKVVGDSLLLFHRSENRDGLAGWNKSGLSDEELLERADTNHELFRF